MPSVRWVSRELIRLFTKNTAHATTNVTATRRILDHREGLVDKIVLTTATKSTLHIHASLMSAASRQSPELDQIVQPELRSLARHGHDGISGHQAGPSRRQRGDVAVNGSVEHTVFAPVRAPDHQLDFLTALRMERMRDPDRWGHLLGAGCIRYVG